MELIKLRLKIGHSGLLALLLAFVFAVNAGAQTKSIGLDEAIAIGLRNNKEIKVAQMDVKKAEAAVREAFGYALPSLDLSAGFNHFISKPKTPFPDFGALLGNATYAILFKEKVIPEDDSKYLPVGYALQSFALSNSFETKVTVSQILFNSSVFRGIGASQIYLDLAKQALRATVSKTVLDVKKAFYGVLLAKESLSITEASMKNAQENLKNVQSYYKQGLVSEFDALQVEVQVENIKPRVEELRRIVNDAKNGMKILLGIDQSEELDVTGAFEYKYEILPGESETVSRALNGNLDLKTLQLQKEVNDEFINLERADYWPMINAFGSYSYAGSSDKFDFQTYSSTIVGVSMSINLFRGMRASNRIDQAEISSLQTGERISLVKNATEMQTRSKLMELRKVQSEITAVERNVELAKRAYDIAVTRYKEGTGTQLEIKNADLELSAAQVNRLQSINQYIVAKAELEQLCGMLDEGYMDLIGKEMND